MKGFSFPYGQKTVFVETTRERKTKSLAKNILIKMQLPDGRADELLYWLSKSECEYKKLYNGENWYLLKGNGFNECGPVNALIHIHII